MPKELQTIDRPCQHQCTNSAKCFNSMYILQVIVRWQSRMYCSTRLTGTYKLMQYILLISGQPSFAHCLCDLFGNSELYAHSLSFCNLSFIFLFLSLLDSIRELAHLRSIAPKVPRYQRLINNRRPIRPTNQKYKPEVQRCMSLSLAYSSLLL